MGLDPKKSSLHSSTTEIKKKPEEAENIFLPEEPKYCLDDIILPQKVKDEILDVATYADNSHLVFEIWGFKKTHKFIATVCHSKNYFGEYKINSNYIVMFGSEADGLCKELLKLL